MTNAILAGLVMFAFGLVAQQSARDVPAKPTLDTGVIEGTVVADEPNGQPLRRVNVELVPGIPRRLTTTDAEGRFVFRGLPPGRYVALTASRPGFVPASYGQKRIGGSGAPIVLAAGQRLTLTIKLLRGAVITGTVLDQGRPAMQTPVEAMLVRVVNGQRVLAPANVVRATTDERGAYRLAGLAPGDYVLSAVPRMAESSGDLRAVTPEEIQWAQQQLLSGSAVAVGISAGRVPPLPALPQPVAYSAVYYPGTTDILRAATVTVAAAQDRAGVDFSLPLVRTARIEGTVLDPDGQPAEKIEIAFVPKDEMGMATTDSLLAQMFRTLRPTATNGTFSLVGVRPGIYTIAVRAALRATPASMTLWASADISVDGADQSGIQLRLEPGMTLSGRVAFEDTAQPPATPQPRATVGLSVAPDANGLSRPISIPAVPVAPDGTFTIAGVPPGRYLLRPGWLASRPPGWKLKSARVGDIEAADHPFEVRRSENISAITVTFTNKSAEVSGTLVDASGHAVTDFLILLFPTDKASWSSRSARFPRTSRTGSDGTFRFLDLLPGDWHLAAVSDFDEQDIYDADFLSQVAAAAIAVRLAEGERKVQDLKIQGGVGRR